MLCVHCERGGRHPYFVVVLMSSNQKCRVSTTTQPLCVAEKKNKKKKKKNKKEEEETEDEESWIEALVVGTFATESEASAFVAPIESSDQPLQECMREAVQQKKELYNVHELLLVSTLHDEMDADQ